MWLSSLRSWVLNMTRSQPLYTQNQCKRNTWGFENLSRRSSKSKYCFNLTKVCYNAYRNVVLSSCWLIFSVHDLNGHIRKHTVRVPEMLFKIYVHLFGVLVMGKLCFIFCQCRNIKKFIIKTFDVEISISKQKQKRSTKWCSKTPENKRT